MPNSAKPLIENEVNVSKYCVSGAALAQPSTPTQETNGCVLALSLRHRNDIADTSVIEAKILILRGVLTILRVFLKNSEFRLLMSN